MTLLAANGLVVSPVQSYADIIKDEQARVNGYVIELTEHELRVAVAVAQGASNREVAANLFVSPKTVDFHLRQIYRKLGISSRTKLAAVLADETQR